WRSRVSRSKPSAISTFSSISHISCNGRECVRGAEALPLSLQLDCLHRMGSGVVVHGFVCHSISSLVSLLDRPAEEGLGKSKTT
ncbi:Os01g0150900, partial [Oryza sativa Japonica Group]